MALAYDWTQRQYYVGIDNDRVAIYQGVSAQLGPVSLSQVVESTNLEVEKLPVYQQMQVTSTIPFGSLEDARALVERLERAID